MKSFDELVPGATLNNGATVLLVAGPGQGDYAVVLARWDHHDASITNESEYVTWRVIQTGDAMWGDYFPIDKLEDACESFIQRAFAYSTSKYDALTDANHLEMVLGDECSNALAAIICDETVRDYLKRKAPELLAQARDALGLPEIQAAGAELGKEE